MSRRLDPAGVAGLLRLREAGDGPLLLCLHGIGSSSASFVPQLDGLGSVARVLAWDAPGYAGSPAPMTALGMDDYADIAAALIELQGHTEAVVLGMSWGGVIAVRLAQRHPEKARALILGDSTRGSGQSAQQATAMRSRTVELADVGPEVFAAQRAPRLLSPRASQRAIDRAAKAMADAVRLPGYGCAAAAMAATDLNGTLGSIEVPTLMLYGEDDRVTGRAESEELARQIPGSVLRVIPRAGHLANQENPEPFNAAVAEFLGSL